MKKLISALKRIRLSQILTICLVSLLIFVGTAFGSGDRSQAQAQTADEVKEEVPEGAESSPLEGGMNEFPDTDPRQDTSEADAKAGSLVEEADQNVTQKSVDSLGQYVENYQQGTPLGERVQNITGGIGSAAQDADRAAKGTVKDISKGAR